MYKHKIFAFKRKFIAMFLIFLVQAIILNDVEYYEWIKYFNMISLFQIIQKLIRLLPNGHQIKREVDFILDECFETMSPMHFHIREVIFVTYNKVSDTLIVYSMW